MYASDTVQQGAPAGFLPGYTAAASKKSVAFPETILRYQHPARIHFSIDAVIPPCNRGLQGWGPGGDKPRALACSVRPKFALGTLAFRSEFQFGSVHFSFSV